MEFIVAAANLHAFNYGLNGKGAFGVPMTPLNLKVV
jgi:hypothetical protein